jgi:ABC-type Fe3+ transport system permease subunit
VRLAFVAAVGNFGIPAILGLPVNYLTLPTLIYRRLTSFGPAIINDAAALSLLVAAVAGVGVLASAWALGRRGVGAADRERRRSFGARADTERLEAPQGRRGRPHHAGPVHRRGGLAGRHRLGPRARGTRRIRLY